MLLFLPQILTLVLLLQLLLLLLVFARVHLFIAVLVSLHLHLHLHLCGHGPTHGVRLRLTVPRTLLHVHRNHRLLRDTTFCVRVCMTCRTNVCSERSSAAVRRTPIFTSSALSKPPTRSVVIPSSAS